METVRRLHRQTTLAIRPIQEAHDHLTGALLADLNLPEPVRAAERLLRGELERISKGISYRGHHPQEPAS
ncbi:MAG: hypothetical protein IS632_04800 [Thaumarchaeota archaeon]|nr:hypothetical protein [Nitrososphaerota archaeon]